MHLDLVSVLMVSVEVAVPDPAGVMLVDEKVQVAGRKNKVSIDGRQRQHTRRFSAGIWATRSQQRTVVALGLGQLGRTLFHAVIVLVADRLQPNCFPLVSRCNRYIGKAASRRCAVPMLHSRSAFDYISLVNDSYGLPPFLVKAGALGDQQNLTAWMNVPIQLCTGIIG